MTARILPDELIRLIREADSIALCSHVSPDGDTIGSALAIRQGLLALGKQVEVYCQDKVPDSLHMLTGWHAFHTEELLDGKHYDLLLSVDVSDEGRMGRCGALMRCCTATAQLDHHGTNPGYCQVNVVDGDAPATGLLAYALLCQLGVAMDVEIAKCLYAAIATDTGNFAFKSTNAETFEIMAELMRCGLPLNEMNRALFRLRPRCQLLLLNRALNSLTFYHGGQVTSMMLSAKDFEECGALPEHADAMVNYALEIAGVRMAALARENGPDTVKFSLRAVDGGNVAAVATAFGGGGHALAAGCTLHGTLEACTAQMVDAMVRSLQPEA